MNTIYIIIIGAIIGFSDATQSCSAGHYSTITYVNNFRRRRRANRKTKQISCSLCPTGQYSIDGSKKTCDGCPSGKWQTLSGASMCDGISCSAGKYGTVGLSTSTTCTSCPSGQYQSQTGKDECISCSAGMWSTDTDAISCQGTPCKDGSVGPLASTSSISAICEKCPRGKFEAINTNSCLECPLGKHQFAEGNSYCIGDDKPPFGKTWEPSNDRTVPAKTRPCLFTIWRKLAFYTSVFLSIVLIYYMYLIRKHNLRTDCIYTIELIFIIYTISVSVLIFNCFYENEYSYIAITIINAILIFSYIVDIIMTRSSKKEKKMNNSNKSLELPTQHNNSVV